jgi:hypothetical protein
MPQGLSSFISEYATRAANVLALLVDKSFDDFILFSLLEPTGLESSLRSGPHLRRPGVTKLRYPQPDNEDEFEQQCLRLYRRVWRNDSLALYGKRGERQDGIDIFDPLCRQPTRAVQCKHHEPTKTLGPAEIEVEVAKAEKSVLDIEHYVIATTAKKSRNAQDTVVALNQRPDKKFLVEIHFWEEICQHAAELGRAIAELVIYGDSILATNADSLQGSGPSFPHQVTTGNTGNSGKTDEPYSTIEKLIDERKLEAAEHELSKLPSIEEATCLPRENEYKLWRLHAKLKLEAGEFDAAGELFLKAYSVCPELEQARQNHVLALSLLGRRQEAYEIAVRYIGEGLKNPVIALRLIDSITSPDQLTEYAAFIEPYLATDENVNTALSHKYLEFEDLDSAHAAAMRAMTITADSPHANLVAGLSLLGAALRDRQTTQTTLLRSAKEHFDTAESEAKAQRFSILLPEVFVHRAAVNALLGDISVATADYCAAASAAAHSAPYAERAIGFFLSHGDYDNALRFLGNLDSTSRESQYLTIVTQFHRAGAAERRHLINQMACLAEADWDRSLECRFHCIQWSLHLNDEALAESFVTEPIMQQHPFQGHAMLAWIRSATNEEEAAKEEAKKALQESVKAAKPNELRLLADILIKLKDDDNAIVLLEQVARAGVFDDDMKALINCAQRFGRHDLLLRLCRELRESGIRDEQLQRLEVNLLSHYAPTEAIKLAAELAQNSDSASYFIAELNRLAVRLNQPEKLNLDPAALPKPSDLLPEESSLVLLPYIANGRFVEALQFVYTQLRLNFESQHAHGQYIYFILQHGERTGLREPPDHVEKDCAALLELASGEKRWIILEDNEPAHSRGEFATTSPMGEVLLGRAVGDDIALPGNPFQPLSGIIREIQTKYVRAFQDSMQNFVHRFPGNSVLQQVNVGTAEKFDPAAVIDGLRDQREHVQKLLAFYRKEPCSLYLLAHRLGVTELEAIKSLAQYPEGTVKCCHITPEDFDRAWREGLPEKPIVVSISAIATITLLDAWRYLGADRQFLVSQHTSELIDSWIREAEGEIGKERGTLSLDDTDKLVFRPSTSEELQSRLDELRKIKANVAQYCAVASSAGFADLAPEKRKIYTDVLGLHNVEAMSLAKDRNALLWTDDQIAGIVGQTDFGTTHVWTQLLLRCLVVKGMITLDGFDLVTAKLASWHYANIIWNARALIAAGVAADWNTGAWPFLQCINLIKSAPLTIRVKTTAVIEFLRDLRGSNCSALKQTAVIQAALDALGDVRLVRVILKRVDQIFGLDVASADFVRLELQYWITSHIG